MLVAIKLEAIAIRWRPLLLGWKPLLWLEAIAIRLEAIPERELSQKEMQHGAGLGGKVHCNQGHLPIGQPPHPDLVVAKKGAHRLREHPKTQTQEVSEDWDLQKQMSFQQFSASKNDDVVSHGANIQPHGLSVTGFFQDSRVQGHLSCNVSAHAYTKNWGNKKRHLRIR